MAHSFQCLLTNSMKNFDTAILLPLSEIIANGFIEQGNFRYGFTQ